jgi:two-component system, NtrC family, sensor histidine kinase PilS
LVLITPVLVAIAATALLFGLYGVIERTWLQQADPQLIASLHLARGLIGSVVAAVIVGWLVMRASPPLLVRAPSEDEWVGGARLGEADRIANFSRWFILMRWITVAVAAVLVFIAVKITGLLPDVVWWPLTATIGVLAGLNVLYMMFLRLDPPPSWLMPVQVYLDLVVLTVLLHFSGGIENPISVLILFHVIIGGVVLRRPQSFQVAAVAIVLFGLLALLEWSGRIGHYTFLVFPHFHGAKGMQHAAYQPVYVASRVALQAVVLLLTAYFVTTLAERLRYDERQMEQLAGRALAERRLLERSLETTATALRVVDRDLRCRWVNRQWTKWFGPSDIGEEVSGYGGVSLDPHPAVQVFQDAHARIVELTPPTAQAQPGGAGDIPQTFQLTAAPLPDRDGNTTLVVEMAQDITHQKQAQAQMLRAGKLAAVGELAGQVAHEVNNPIAIISAKARLLLSDPSLPMPQKVRQELEKVTELSDRVAKIAQGLLSYCRPSVASRSLMDLRDPIRQALALIVQPAATRGIEIQDKLPATPLRVDANTDEIQQVFLNLMLNALDAMPRGGRLTVTASHDAGVLPDGRPCLSVTVADDGVGIETAVCERAFEPFFTTKEPGKGTGLGLSICQGLIRSHGGEIGLTSRPGQGTRVSIRLPLAGSSDGTETNHE